MMKIKVICRVCLEEGDMKSIFKTNCLNSHKISCADAIIKISHVAVDENDGLPGHICKKCLSKLKVAYKFKLLCEESHLKLIDRKNEMIKKSDADIINLEFIANDKNNDDEKDEAGTHNINNVIFDKDAEFSSNNYENQSIKSNDDLLNDVTNEEVKKSGRIDQKKHKNKHKEKSTKTENKINKSEPLKCNLCDKIFQTNYSLKKHKEAHAGIKPYFCEICQKNFRSEYTHKALHASDRQLQCEICAKIFLRVASLRMHLLAHRNELPFQCTFLGCNRAFPQNSRLQLHLKVHTNERNFICQYCSHAARDKQQLTVHIRYFHTKEKNFLCGTCGKAFVSPQARYYHAKRHENIRNHHCPHCDKSFVFAFGLQEHLFTHTGEKRFSCSICEAKFSRKAHKEKHESRLHGIKIPVKKRNTIIPALSDT